MTKDGRCRIVRHEGIGSHQAELGPVIRAGRGESLSDIMLGGEDLDGIE